MGKKICVITGGGSGMGLSAGKFMPTDHALLITGRTLSKLEKAAEELREGGHEVFVHTCDTSDRASVRELAEYAASLGEITNVINAAGMSPGMKTTQEQLLRINALGTVHINEEFSRRMGKGSVIVDISSNSAYSMPQNPLFTHYFKLAETKPDEFVEKLVGLSSKAKGDYYKNGFAYMLSKMFVVWYAEKCAFEYGPKGIRVVSLSPGLIATGMGELEKDAGGYLIEQAAERRMGEPDELGFAIATVADERNGYLAGVDILCDGGSTHGKKWRKSKRKK